MRAFFCLIICARRIALVVFFFVPLFLCGYFYVAVLVYRHHYIAVVVRAINRYVVRFKTVEGGLTRMIEFVAVGIATDYRILERIRVQKRIESRSCAAVMSDFQYVAIDFARALDDKRLVEFVAVAREHNTSAVVFQNSNGRYGVFAFGTIEIRVVVILLRRAIKHQSVRRFLYNYAVRVYVGIDVKHDFAIRLGERGDEKFRIRYRSDCVFVGESARVECVDLILQRLFSFDVVPGAASTLGINNFSTWYCFKSSSIK